MSATPFQLTHDHGDDFPLPDATPSCQHHSHSTNRPTPNTWNADMEKPPLTSSPVRSTASSSGMHSSGHHTEDHLSIRGERAMWRAVIVQALMDAACGSKKPEELQSKQEALVWLRGTSRDFITVANHAGFEPEYLRTMVTRALQNNCNWRAMPGHGTRQQVNRTRKTDRKPGQRR